MAPSRRPNLIEAVVEPRSPLRLSARGSGETRVDRAGVVHRLLHVEEVPVLVRAWMIGSGEVVLRAEGVPALSAGAETSRERLEIAVARMRFCLGLDQDMSGFYAAFKRDPLLGPMIHRKPWIRPRHTPWPWGALLRAITKQLIESSRAAQIERRIVRRWGTRWERGGDAYPLFDTPGAATIAGLAPAELVACDLTEGRSLAMIRCAHEVAAGRAELSDPASDSRLLAIREIGPWTMQCLGLEGRGEPDSLPAGDLGYIKLVGRLAGLGRRATVEEVEEFYAPYAPYRGLAGAFTLTGYHQQIAAGPPLRFA
ncbi:MAG: DNA-3-methyladenine glycosylase [Solirubrobacterales bacterium]